jgi:hypothetical protein
MMVRGGRHRPTVERPPLTTHQLAKLLLDKPDVPVITHAVNHSMSPVQYGNVNVVLLKEGLRNMPMCMIGDFDIPSEDDHPEDRRVCGVWDADDYEVWSARWTVK